MATNLDIVLEALDIKADPARIAEMREKATSIPGIEGMPDDAMNELLEFIALKADVTNGLLRSMIDPIPRDRALGLKMVKFGLMHARLVATFEKL